MRWVDNALRQCFSPGICVVSPASCFRALAVVSHWVVLSRWTHRRCFPSETNCWRCSLLAFLFTRLLIAAGDAETSFAEMIRYAARRETTPMLSPVARSWWTIRTTASPWSPENFLEYLFCCFSSRWDTLSRGCCVQDQGRTSHLKMDSQRPPHRKKCLWRAVHRTARRIQLPLRICQHTMNANICRHMRRQFGTERDRRPESCDGQATRREHVAL